MSDSAACEYAAQALKEAGAILCNQAEQAQYLLYHVPTPAFLRDEIPQDKIIIGGNLDFLPAGVRKMDLLRDEDYLAANAALTAEAAIGLLTGNCDLPFSQTRVLMLGWGRIGKCLERLLRALGFPVTVCARRKSELALASALGCSVCDADALIEDPSGFHYMINTAPYPVLPQEAMQKLDPETVCMELASKPGFLWPGVVQAKGLPGKYKAKASGALIAKTVLRLLGGEAQ